MMYWKEFEITHGCYIYLLIFLTRSVFLLLVTSVSYEESFQKYPREEPETSQNGKNSLFNHHNSRASFKLFLIFMDVFFLSPSLSFLPSIFVFFLFSKEVFSHRIYLFYISASWWHSWQYFKIFKVCIVMIWYLHTMWKDSPHLVIQPIWGCIFKSKCKVDRWQIIKHFYNQVSLNAWNFWQTSRKWYEHVGNC